MGESLSDVVRKDLISTHWLNSLDGCELRNRLSTQWSRQRPYKSQDSSVEVIEVALGHADGSRSRESNGRGAAFRPVSGRLHPPTEPVNLGNKLRSLLLHSVSRSQVLKNCSFGSFHGRVPAVCHNLNVLVAPRTADS
jgi:hypothetical protein